MESALKEKYWSSSRIAVALSFPCAIAVFSFLFALVLLGLLGSEAKLLLIPGFCVPLVCSAAAIFTVPVSFYFLLVHARSIGLGVQAWCWIISFVWLLFFFVAIFPRI